MQKIFRNNKGVLSKLSKSKFDSEKMLQVLVERNLGTVFDGLELLTTEFQLNDLRPDSV